MVRTIRMYNKDGGRKGHISNPTFETLIPPNELEFFLKKIAAHMKNARHASYLSQSGRVHSRKGNLALNRWLFLSIWK